jgi:hypothetical protein
LTGTWSGERTLPSGERERVVLVMTWDGKAIAGTINPGPEAIPLGRVTVDYDAWTVRIEAKAPKPAQEILIEGQLADLGSWHRTFGGRWVQGSAEGTFTLRRD